MNEASIDGWTTKRLGDIATLLSGGTPSKRDPRLWQGDIPWLSPKDIKRPLLRDTEDHISAAGLEAGSRLAPAKTIFIVVRGMSLAKDVPIALALVPMAFNQDVKALIPGDNVVPEFLLFSLQANKAGLMREVGTAAHGTRRMGTTSLEGFVIPFPPKKEQLAIADILLRLRAAVDVQEQIVKRLRTVKAATMAMLLCQGVHDGPQEAGEGGNVPERWRIVRLRDIAKIGNGSTPKRTEPLFWTEGSIPWLTSSKVYDGIIEAADEFVTELARQKCHLPLVPARSLVIAITGQGRTLGTAALVTFETCVNQHLAYITPKGADVVPEFLLAYLESRYQYFRQVSAAGGSTKGALTCGFLADLKIPLPPVDEQQAIARLQVALHSSIEAHVTRAAVLRFLFTSTLIALMSGQVRVVPAA